MSGRDMHIGRASRVLGYLVLIVLGCLVISIAGTALVLNGLPG